jgi:hypothetical protein
MSNVVYLNKMMYQNTEIVKLEFSYNEDIVRLVKNIRGARWNSFYRWWYVEKRAGLLEEVLNIFKGKAQLDYKAIKNDSVINASAEPEEFRVAFQSITMASRKRNPVRVKQYALCI